MNTEVRATKSGHEAIIRDGQQLCSLVDPIKEAVQWVDGLRLDDSPCEQIVVLGMGAGYHLRALRERHPDMRILVIEKHKEIVQVCSRTQHLHVSALLIVQKNSTAEVLASEVLKSFFRHPTRVVNHYGSTFLDLDFYNPLQKRLNGRLAESINFFLSHRPDLGQVYQPLPESNSEQLWSIVDLKSYLKPAHENSTSHQIHHLLLELVK